MESVEISAYLKIPGGGRYADLAIGKGAEIAEGSKVSLQWVLRRSNGYYVDGSVKMLSSKSGAVVTNPNFDETSNFLFTVGDGTAMPGVDAGVRGMRQGGKRRLVLPTKAAYTLPIDKSPGPLPDGYGPRRQIERELQRDDPYNFFYIEVEATRVR
uniref:peptidylprolyl isomerase n=1 Tax=Calcidiscus leptoporus TaxID=127549 RepID=A0A7S0JGI1_9EUKA